MTIEKARKLLGKIVIGKTDREVEKIISQASVVCDCLLEVFDNYLTSYKIYYNNANNNAKTSGAIPSGIIPKAS